jgi:twitching motility protein PilU
LLTAGDTGSGKTTTLAAQTGHRNSASAGHIITVEDSAEYVHMSKKSLVSHRTKRVDTYSWHHARRNTLRQAPDVILIGHIRGNETMEHTIAFATALHLCLRPLHVNTANQAIDRIINFFPEDRRNPSVMDESTNLRSII